MTEDTTYAKAILKFFSGENSVSFPYGMKGDGRYPPEEVARAELRDWWGEETEVEYDDGEETYWNGERTAMLGLKDYEEITEREYEVLTA